MQGQFYQYSESWQVYLASYSTAMQVQGNTSAGAFWRLLCQFDSSISGSSGRIQKGGKGVGIGGMYSAEKFYLQSQTNKSGELLYLIG